MGNSFANMDLNSMGIKDMATLYALQQAQNQSSLLNPQASLFSKDGLKSRFGSLGLQDIAGGVSGLAGLYMGNKQLKMAKDQYNTNKQFGNANLVNTAKAYNSDLTNMYQSVLDARKDTGANMATLQEYLAQHGVSDKPIA